MSMIWPPTPRPKPRSVMMLLPMTMMRPRGPLTPGTLPDLLVIDGGKGRTAGAALTRRSKTFNWATQLDAIGLAKDANQAAIRNPQIRVFLPPDQDPVRLRDNTAELFVLSRIRDRSAPFAVSFHQKLREKRTIRSAAQRDSGHRARRQQALLSARQCSADSQPSRRTSCWRFPA